MENAYDFRKKLLTVHEKGLRNNLRKTEENELELKEPIILMDEAAGEVSKTAVFDFIDYLKVSMGIASRVISDGRIISYAELPEKRTLIRVSLAEKAGINLGEADGYRGFVIQTDELGVCIYGKDERGIGQALFYLEDIMNFEGAPVIPYGTVRKKTLFSPQMVHSGYGVDEYPDEYLARIAHEGRDAILVFTKGVNQTPSGYMDFNDLIKRAARYGIDVYAYSKMISGMHPEEEGAEAYYDELYGRLFKECTGLKGVTLVGESVEFPSNDPHVFKGRYTERCVDGIPRKETSPGWYPCEDYPIWLDMIKKVVRRYNQEADIVFWTYNWGYQPQEARLRLIESLPTDISLQATFEMFETKAYGESHGICADYTLSFVGPGNYFVSEAEAAKKRGIRLYSMTNTGGRTWDFGVIPYEPMPYQWMKRYEAMRHAAKQWGLCGIMETHHYGFYPSFISKLSKWAYMEPEEPLEAILEKILKAEFGCDGFEKVNEALKLWSEAITYYVPSNADQYGAFRVGPSYPFCLDVPIQLPASPEAMFGSRICKPCYGNGPDQYNTVLSIRIHEEMKFLEKMRELLRKGLEGLEAVPDKNEKLLLLINMGRFILNCVQTGLHAKKWYTLKCRMNVETSGEVLHEILDKMEQLLKDEIENAKATIPLVEKDSLLGFEPSMLYMTDRCHLEWKIRQVRYILEDRLSAYRASLPIRKDTNKF